jgi:endonuclease G
MILAPGARRLLIGLAALLLFGAGSAASAKSDCTGFYLGQQAPAVTDSAKAGTGRIFCHSFYSVSYSTARRDPIWAAERLTKAMAKGGDAIGRVKKKFAPQAGLTSLEQGSHADYNNSPYDRGHMTPANDAPDIPTQRDTFVVTNIVPQTAQLNEHLWQYLEASVHQLAEVDDELFIVTGPVFAATPPLLASRIAIPEATYKAVYDPTQDIAIAYVATNEEVSPVCTIISVAELTRRTGIDPFPSLPAAKKNRLPTLALPHGINIVRGKPHEVPLPDCH